MFRNKVLISILSVSILIGLTSQDVFAATRSKRRRKKKVVTELEVLPAHVGPKKLIAVIDF